MHVPRNASDRTLSSRARCGSLDEAEIAAAARTGSGSSAAGSSGSRSAFGCAKLGHHVELFEAAPELGGLAASHDYGSFRWDRFYHCILPQDRHLIGLLGDLGLGSELRWTETGTGYYARGPLVLR